MKKSLHTIIFAAAFTAAYLSAPAMAQAQASAASAQAAMSDGEIKKVDKETGKLTIKHGELKNVGMGAMTMAFKVKDAAMLDQVKAGDKVHFIVEKINGAYTVTTIEAAK